MWVGFRPGTGTGAAGVRAAVVAAVLVSRRAARIRPGAPPEPAAACASRPPGSCHDRGYFPPHSGIGRVSGVPRVPDVVRCHLAAGGSPQLPPAITQLPGPSGGAAHPGRVFHDREGFTVCADSKVFAIMDGIPGNPPGGGAGGTRGAHGACGVTPGMKPGAWPRCTPASATRRKHT